MNPWMYMPVAGVSVPVFLVVGLGMLVGLLSGLFGVGGGFLLTPLLIMIGIPPTVAAASDANQIVAASASGACAHARARTVDFRMGSLLLLGGIIGGTVGVQVVKVLRAAGQADFVIILIYIVMLGGIGVYMFRDSVRDLRGVKSPRRPEVTEADRPSVHSRFANMLPWKIDFPRSGCHYSVLLPIALGILVGILSAVMGVGGGFIMVPIMVYLLRMPMHVVVGTSLFQICFTCMNVTLQQSIYNHTVDAFLALTLLVGSVVGAQIGARVGRRLKADQLKILMAVLILVTMGKMLLDLLVTPEVRVAIAGAHG
jgi:uncharacterized membrane protein YfcA